MEQIYDPLIYGASERFFVSNYFNKYTSYIKQYNQQVGPRSDDDDIELLSLKTMLDTDVESIQQLSEACSIDHLTCTSENTSKFPIESFDFETSNAKLPDNIIITDKPIELEVIKKKNELEKKRNVHQLIAGNKRAFYRPIRLPVCEQQPDLKEGDDFIMSVLIYKPFKFALRQNTWKRLRFNHEILILGCNTLEQLRDKIICSLDEGLFKEVDSTNENITQFIGARRIYPSGFMFINDTFYNDFRSPEAIDYSQILTEWARNRNIAEFKAQSMSNVLINSLELRLGYPYLYMHQGDCEHILVFSDARLLQRSDCLHSKYYPHVFRMNGRPNRKCFLCSADAANWICFDSDRLPQNKMLLCTNCCNSYNYLDGEKVGNFRLYPYYEKHTS